MFVFRLGWKNKVVQATSGWPQDVGKHLAGLYTSLICQVSFWQNVSK